jgi:hypothetical protein
MKGLALELDRRAELFAIRHEETELALKQAIFERMFPTIQPDKLI